MTETAPIYGFEFLHPFEVAGLRFDPIEIDHSQAHRLARDPTRHHLTGTVSSEKLSDQTLFHLAAVLSFIEHMDVQLGDPVEGEDAPSFPERYFDLALPYHSRHQGGGAVIGVDGFHRYRSSGQTFIELALDAMAKAAKPRPAGVSLLLFSCVETFRQRRPFMEITYFLLISSLEAFCRHQQGDFTSKNAATPITKTLRGFGFNLEQDCLDTPQRSVMNYLHIRNALFHQGQFTRTVNINGSDLVLNCGDYFFQLSMLVSLTIMKAVGFDDGRTNWDAWIDRQLHK